MSRFISFSRPETGAVRCEHLITDYHVSVFIQTKFKWVTAAYVECLARILKVPATILLLPAIATSAPGRLLYSAMRSLVEGKYRLAWEHGVTAARYSLAVAAGISLVWAAFMTAGALAEYRKKRL